MNKVVLIGCSALIALTATIFSASAAPADRGDHLWPDPATGGTAAHERDTRDRAQRKHDRELVSRPFISRHGPGPKCSVRDVSTHDEGGNIVTLRRHLCD